MTLPKRMRLRHQFIEVRVRHPQRGWMWSTSGCTIEQIEQAEHYRVTMQAQLDAGFGSGGPLLVRTYAEDWLKRRKSIGLASVKDDEGRMRKHVLPELGNMRMDEVRPRHLRDLVYKLRKTELAPRTIINVWTVIRTMFNDSVVDEVIRENPAVLRRGDLPKKRDKDPEWRSLAVFTRAEVEQIVSDDRVPWDRRMLYALQFLTASRFGEAAALRWRHYETSIKPLGRMVVAGSYNTKLKREKETKSETPRRVPVHPVLSRLLAEWRMRGWALQFGSAPGPDDLIVPSREGRNRSVNHMLKKFHQDLDKIGLRTRRQHDSRRTFKSIALDDGANESRLRWITHGRRDGVDGAYDEPSWRALCEVVQGMRLELRNRKPAKLRRIK